MDCVIYDLDGTICDLKHRLHLIAEEPKDHNTFNSLVLDDRPISDVCYLINLLITAKYETSNPLIFFVSSGRPEHTRAHTEEWLQTHMPRLYDCLEEILLRPEGDFAEDRVIKMAHKDYLENQGYNIRLVLDDRQSVVDEWRKEGITCLQVDAWDEDWNKKKPNC